MAGSNILSTVLSSCQSVLEAHKDHVHIDLVAAAEVAAQLDPAEVAACCRGLQLPLRFANQAEEVTFMAVSHLVNFGSGYDTLLLKKCKRDARETCQYGALGMHMGAKKLDAVWMSNFAPSDVQKFFGFDSHEDAPVPNIPCVTMSRPGLLSPLTQALAAAVREAGITLQAEGEESPGSAILGVVEGLHKKGHPTPAAVLVQELVDSTPAFQDSALFEGKRIIFARRAQMLVADLHIRFGKEDPRFDFVDAHTLTADSGNLIPAVLRHKGVVCVSEEIASIIDQGEELVAGPHERALRAAAVCGVQAIVEAAALHGKKLSAAQLGKYWEVLTEKGQDLNGKLTKHLTRAGNVAY